jgi:hypothetical protein
MPFETSSIVAKAGDSVCRDPTKHQHSKHASIRLSGVCMRLVPVFVMLSYFSCSTTQQVSAQKACKPPRDINKQMAKVCKSSHCCAITEPPC